MHQFTRTIYGALVTISRSTTGLFSGFVAFGLGVFSLLAVGLFGARCASTSFLDDASAATISNDQVAPEASLPSVIDIIYANPAKYCGSGGRAVGTENFSEALPVQLYCIEAGRLAVYGYSIDPEGHLAQNGKVLAGSFSPPLVPQSKVQCSSGVPIFGADQASLNRFTIWCTSAGRLSTVRYHHT